MFRCRYKPHAFLHFIRASLVSSKIVSMRKRRDFSMNTWKGENGCGWVIGGGERNGGKRGRESHERARENYENVLCSDFGQSVKRLYHIILKQYCSISRRINETLFVFLVIDRAFPTRRSNLCARARREERNHKDNERESREEKETWYFATARLLSVRRCKEQGSRAIGSAADRVHRTLRKLIFRLSRTVRSISRPSAIYFCFLAISLSVGDNEPRSTHERKQKKRNERDPRTTVHAGLSSPRVCDAENARQNF